MNNYQVTKTARTAAAVLAAITLAGLLIRFVLAAERHGSVLSGMSHLYQYFTITTNSLVLWVMASIAMGKPVHRVVIHSTVVSIMGVGIIFHALLSQYGAQEGLDGLANLITHTIVPIFTPLWWLVHADIKAAKWGDSLYALIWPAAYCVYALVRAEFSNFYPYAFIDLSKLGWGGLAQSVFNLSLAFLVLALLTIGYARMVSALQNRRLAA